MSTVAINTSRIKTVVTPSKEEESFEPQSQEKVPEFFHGCFFRTVEQFWISTEEDPDGDFFLSAEDRWRNNLFIAEVSRNEQALSQQFFLLESFSNLLGEAGKQL